MEEKQQDYILDKIADHKLFSRFFTRESFRQFCKYVIVGGVSFIIEYIMYYILLQKFDVWYVLASSIVYFIIFWFNFVLNRIWSFKSKHHIGKQLLKYAMLFTFNLIATNGILLLLSEVLNLDPRISKVIVMILIIPWNFTMYKRVIYK